MATGYDYDEAIRAAAAAGVTGDTGVGTASTIEDLDRAQTEMGQINEPIKPSVIYGKGGLTKELGDAEFGRQAKQAIRDNEVAGVVAAQKDAALGAMYNRLRGMLDSKRMEADMYRQDRDSLANALMYT